MLEWDAVRLPTMDEPRPLFAEELGVVAYAWDVQTRTVVRAPGLAALIGFGPAEHSTDVGWWECRIHPDDLDGTVDAWYAALDDPAAEQVDAEYRVRPRRRMAAGARQSRHRAR